MEMMKPMKTLLRISKLYNQHCFKNDEMNGETLMKTFKSLRVLKAVYGEMPCLTRVSMLILGFHR